MTQPLPTASLSAVLSSSRLRAATLSLLLCGAAALPARAQLGYSSADVQIASGTYTDLGTNGSAVTMANNDDANSAPQNIGFSFNFAGQTFTQFVMNTNGFIKLGNTPPSRADLYYTDGTAYTGVTPFSSTNAADEFIVSPFNYDLQPANGAANPVDFRVETSGTAPNRVTTIQWKNVSDKTRGAATKQYSRISFQVKLYEGSNMIEFVYGASAASNGTAGYRGADVGLRGASGTTEFLTSTKASATAWDQTVFQDTDYGDSTSTANRHNFRANIRPTSGLTYRFNAQQANDVAVPVVYTLSQLPAFAIPHQVQAAVINRGSNNQTNVAVTLNVTGSTTFTNTQTISNLPSGDTVIVTFAAYTPTGTAANLLTVSVANDDNNANNTATAEQEISTTGTFSYADNNQPTTSYGLNAPGLWLVRYNTNSAQSLLAVNIFFGGDAASVGKTFNAVLTDDQGNILNQSANYVLTTADLNAYHTFTFATQPNVAGDFYVGLNQLTAGAWYPLGVQDEVPLRPNTYFIVTTGAPFDLSGAGGLPIRLMIQAQLGAPAACQAPTGLAATNVTATGATVTFNTGGGANFTVIYGPAGFNPATGGMSVTTTTGSVNLMGLASSIRYDVYVIQNCGAAGNSAPAGPLTFNTGCQAVTITSYPYTESFDNVNFQGDLPCGTDIEDSNSDGFSWLTLSQDSALAQQVNLTAHTGSYFLSYIYNFDDTTQVADDWFFLPPMQMTAGGQPYNLSFWQRVAAASFPEGLEVMYGTAPNSGAMTTTIYSNTNLANTAYQQRNATPIRPATSGVYYIGFHGISLANEFVLMLDDIQVTGPNPTGLSTDELTRAVAVYPNPSAGKVTLNLTETGARNISLRVLDNLGRVVYTGTATDNAAQQLDLSQLSNGLYTLQVKLDDQTVTRQLSVQK